MFTYALFALFACETAPETVDEPTAEYEDSDDIPTPSDDLEDDEEDVNGGSDDNSDEETEPLPSGPSTWLFSQDESLLYLQVWRDSSAWGSSLAHDHVIRAGVWEGTLSYDTDDLSACAMTISLAVSELVVDEDGMRSLVGYSDTISSSDRDEIRENMLSSDQLDASRHPDIWFESVSCAGDTGDSGSLTVTGDLSARGQTSRVQIPLDFEIRGDAFYVVGDFSLSHDDFGMEPYEAYWGAVRNDDELGFAFDMVGALQ